MKQFSLILLSLLIVWELSAAADFREAIAAGDWEAADVMLQEAADPALLLEAGELALENGGISAAYDWLCRAETKLRADGKRQEELLRTRALLEYIMRHSANQVELSLKQAAALTGETDAVTAMDNAAILLGRAENWKRDGRQEWAELAACLAEGLDGVRDNADPGTVFRRTLLQVRCCNLQTGDYQAGIELLRQVLNFYYPNALHLSSYRRALPYDACRLLIALNEQYAGMARRSNAPAEKTRLYSQAAGFLLNAANGLSEQAPEYQRACDELLKLQEELRLLGYRLKLPEHIVPSGNTGLVLLYAMLDQKRFLAAKTAIDRELAEPGSALPRQSLTVLKLLAEIGTADYAAAADLSEALDPALLSGEDFSLLCRAARQLREAKAIPEAAVVVARALEAPLTAHPDYPGALYLAAQLALDTDRPGKAADFFTRYGETLSDPEMRSRIFLNAALCRYRQGAYEQVRELVLAASSGASPEDAVTLLLLGAQAALQSGDSETAQQELSGLLQHEGLSDAHKRKTLFLAAVAALENADHNRAFRCLWQYLEEFPSDMESIDCAGKLLDLYKNNPDDDALQRLADILIGHHANRPETLSLVRDIAGFRLKTLASAGAIDTFRRYESAELNQEQLLKLLRLLIGDEYAAASASPALMAAAIVNTAKLPSADAGTAALEIHLCRLEILVKIKEYDAAVTQADELLALPEQHRFFEVKNLRAVALCGVGDYSGARADCREVIGHGDPAAIRRANLIMAETWRAERQYAKAVAAAWLAVPFSGLERLPDGQREIVRNALELIVECAGMISSDVDIEEAGVMLKQISQP